MDKNKIIEIINNYNIQSAYILATFDNMVCIGKLENNEFNFYYNVNFNLCSQLRIFNKQMELKIFKVDNEIYTKLIKDEDYEDKLEDEYMFVSGNKIVESNENFTVLEQLGRKIALPLKLTNSDLEKGIRVVVRNYCEIDSNSQVVICESRLLGFSLNEKEVI